MSEFWEGRKIVVTGGHGFLGNHVMGNLAAAGAEGVSCSRSSGCDLRDVDQASRFFSAHKPDMVINCAANQGGLDYQRQCPATIFLDNMLMGTNTMEAARRAGARKYVNIIAGCTYPGDERPLQREADLEAGPLHPSVENYAAPKRAALVQARCYRRQYGFNAVSVVLVNMYGPGEHFTPDRSHAVAALIRKFYEAKRDGLPEVTVWGTGRPVRDWLYVEDGAAAVLRIAEHYDAVEPINVGSGHGYSMTDLAEIIREVVGCQSRIVYDTSKPDGAPRKLVDITRLKGVLDWTPETPIREGIGKTLDWFVGNYEGAVAAKG